MGVSMQQVVSNGECTVCLEKFDQKSVILGHEDPDKTNKKIHHLIHKECLVKAFHSRGSLECPTCRRLIKHASVLSWRDLTKEAKSGYAVDLLTASASAGLSAASGALFAGRALSSGEFNDFHLVRAAALGAVVSGSLSHAVVRARVLQNPTRGTDRGAQLDRRRRRILCSCISCYWF